MKRFQKEYDNLTNEQRDLVDAKLKDLAKDPRPPGLRFEKLKGYDDPAVYTVHLTGNYKLSMEIVGSVAYLRRVGPHNKIDRSP